MIVTIQPSQACGTAAAPPSKSMAHRLLLASALAGEPCLVENVDLSRDVRATVDCLQALGAELTETEGGISVNGAGLLRGEGPVLLPCGASGSTLRFLIPVVLLTGRTAVFTGDESLFARPLDVYETLCARQGILFQKHPDRLVVQGRLKPGTFELPGNVSSQFVTGLLYALPLLPEPSSVRLLPPVESRSYIDMTKAVLRDFSIRVMSVGDDRFHVPANQSYRPHRTRVEGDWSNAAFLEAFNLVGGRVRVTGLNRLSSQGDKRYPELYRALLKGKPTINLSDNPDLAPVLMTLAAACHGAIFTGTGRLRLKESDRGAAMAEELGKLGAQVLVEPERIWVGDTGLRRPTEPLESHNDHRVAMALAVACSLCGGTIRGAEAVRKSWPDYFRVLQDLGVELTVETEEEPAGEAEGLPAPQTEETKSHEPGI